MAANFLGLAILMTGQAALAQDSSPATEKPNWTPAGTPGSRPTPNKLNLKTQGEEKQAAFGASEKETSYINPSTGSLTGVPPPPPIISSGEWKLAGTPTPAPAIQQAAMQVPMDMRFPEETQEITIQLEPPGPAGLFGSRDSESGLQERMRQEARDQKIAPERIYFPEEPVLSTQAYASRKFPPMMETVEPNYVCYGRLLFEEKNSERYGWDLGFIQPFVSGGKFFFDVAALPYHIWTAPCRRYECSAGYCLPGNPVPYLWYPQELSLTGSVMEAGTVIALIAMFPG